MPGHTSQSGSDGQDSHEHLKPTETSGGYEEILKSEQVQIDRKRLTCTLKENRRGLYLRISEEAGNHRNTIIIPASGLGDLRRVLDDMQKVIRRDTAP